MGAPDAGVQLAQTRIGSSFSIKCWGRFVVVLSVGGWVFCWFSLEVHPAFGALKGCANRVPAGGDRCICTVTD